MPSNIFFQAFLFVDVFVIGVLAALSARHAYAHFRPSKHETDEKPHLSAAVKEKLLHDSQVQFEAVLHKSVESLQHDLESTTDQVNDLIKRFASDIIGDELERYRVGLSKLHKQAEVDLGSVKQEMVGHEAELKTQLAKEIEIEKQRLISQIDTKLGDAVGSFLIETLQHNVDLGNQGAYLVAMLEEHKAEFVKELSE